MPVEEKTKILEGYEFFVLTGTAEWERDKVENVIRENGGTIVRIERDSTLCILVGSEHPRVQISKQQNANYDLVKLEWLKRVLDAGKFSMYTPFDMLHTGTKTKYYFMSRYDMYGDSYTEKATYETLQLSMQMVDYSDNYANLMSWEMNQLDAEIKYSHALTVFRGKLGYFDNYQVVNDVCSSEIYKSMEDEIKFRFLGGTVSSVLNRHVDCVVVNSAISCERKDVILANLIDVKNDSAAIIENSVIIEEYEKMKQKMHIKNGDINV